MRKTILILLLLIGGYANSFAQTKEFQIEGITQDFPNRTIVKLRDTENNKWVDSTFIENEKFIIKATQPDYGYASQYFLFFGDKKENVPILIENGEVLKFSLDTISFPEISVLESKNQKRYQELDTILYSRYTEIAKAFFTINELNKLDQEGIESYITQLENQISDERKEVEKILLDAPDDFVVLHYLANYINLLQPDKEVVSTFYNTLNEDKRNSKYAKALNYYLSNQKLYLNDILFDSKGEIIKLSDIPSTKDFILLDIASNYCPFSQKVKGDLENVVKNYESKLDVYSIHVDNDLIGLNEYAVDGYDNWKFFYHPEGRFSNFFIKYKIIGTPTYFLFDRKGKLIDTWINDENLEEHMSKLLK